MPIPQESKHLWALLEFSIRSLPQAYGRSFLWRIVLRHPRRLVGGLLTYGQVVRTDLLEQRALCSNGEDAFVCRAAGDAERLLVATGFCQKPLRAVPQNRGRDADAAYNAYECPAGRFNHDCLYLARLELDSPRERTFHPACANCSIRVLGHAALRAGASFAVLTSALDIANDILVPALEERRFTRVLFAICPYSMEPISLALLICGVEGYLFPYQAGSCADYHQWLRADRGDKPEQTVLSLSSMVRILSLLRATGAGCSLPNDSRPTHYQQVDHAFRPR